MIILALTACGLFTAAEPPRARPTPRVAARAPQGPPDLVVDCYGGADYTTISDAIAAAPDRGYIQVHPCRYHERIDFGGKTLWIASTDGPETTIIDADDDGSAVTAKNGEGDGTAIVGFKLDDATDETVDVELASLRLQDVIIEDTQGTHAVRVRSGKAELVGVDIDSSNETTSDVIWMDRGALSIRGGSLHCATSDGIFLGHGGFVVDATTVDCPGTRSIRTENSVGRIDRSSLTGNVEILTEEVHPDDLVWMENDFVQGTIQVQFGTFTLQNAIVTGQLRLLTTADTVTVESSIFLGTTCAIDDGPPPGLPLGTVRNNDFVAGLSLCAGTDVIGTRGNVAVDPLFVANNDLHLQAGSPLIDAGVSNNDYDDIDGSRNDIGLHGGRFDIDGGW